MGDQGAELAEPPLDVLAVPDGRLDVLPADPAGGRVRPQMAAPMVITVTTATMASTSRVCWVTV